MEVSILTKSWIRVIQPEIGFTQAVLAVELANGNVLLVREDGSYDIRGCPLGNIISYEGWQEL